MTKLRVATRKSPLAMRQTEIVCLALKKQFPDLVIDVIPMVSEGDKNLSTSLSKIGGKGLFVKELEHALLNDQADFAVHSFKDFPYAMDDRLCAVATLKRDNPFDVLISKTGETLEALPKAAVIGTSSLRREAMLKHYRPDLVIKPLRGNINTRLSKLASGEYDAIILAMAGLERMGLKEQVTQILPPPYLLPAVAQGAIVLQCRSDDESVKQQLSVLNDLTTERCVSAERAVSQTLKADCHWPLAAYAEFMCDELHLHAMLSDAHGQHMVEVRVSQAADNDPKILGRLAAERLLAEGGRSIVDALHE